MTRVLGMTRAATGARRRGVARRGGAFAIWALLPCAAIFALFALYPAIQLVRLSLSEVDLTNGAFSESLIGLSNFRAIGSDSIGADSVVNTAIFAAISVPLTLIGGTVLAVLVDRAILLAALARRVLLLPMAVAPVVVSVVWLLVLNPSIGSLNKAFTVFGVPAQAWLGSRTGAMIAIIAVDVWHWTPLVFLLVYTALRGLDPEIAEAARVDGASQLQLLRFVVLPLLMPVLVVAGLLRLVMCVKAFDEMYLLTGGGPGDATTLVSLHIRGVFFDQLKLGYGAAFSVAVMVGIVAVVGLAVLVRRRLLRGWLVS